MFNLGLRKTLEDLARSVHGELGAFGGEGRLWLRGSRIREDVEALATRLSGPAFALTVDKPDSGDVGDDNARRFGSSNGQAVHAFRSFLTALRMYYSEGDAVGGAWGATSLGHLATSCLHAELAISRWVDEAFDHEAALQATQEFGDAAKQIAEGKAALDEVRRGLVDIIRRESPGRSMHGMLL